MLRFINKILNINFCYSIFLFILLCGGSIFLNSYSVNDPQIVPKWLFTGMGIGVFLLFISLKQFGPKTWQRKKPNLHILYASILFLCWVQALYGILQALKLCTPGITYTVTGSFDNPAGFATCLCAGLPLAFPFLKSRRKGIRWFTYVVICTLITAVCLCQSRTGVLSILTVAGCILYPYLPPIKYKKVYIILLLISLLTGVYFLKKDSADGRLLIWKCTWQMIKEHPLTGWGKGAFTAHYMDYQAAYFRTHPQSRFTLLADNVNHPFNEYLNVFLTNGFPALICVVVIGAFLYNCYRKKPSWKGKAAGLSLLSIGILSLFSYPFSYPFTWIIVVLNGYVLIRQARFHIKISQKKRKIGAICITILSIYLLYNVTQRTLAEREWKRISDLSLAGQIKEMLPQYKQLTAKLGNNPFFLYNYAAELYMIERYNDCLPLLKACRNHWADYDLEMLFGETYFQLKQYEKAAEHYKTATEMCPVKFIPLYKLYLVRKEQGENEKAHTLALQIINKKVKVPSFEINRIKAKMKIDLNKQIKQ